MELLSPRLKNFRVLWFAVTMGLFGLTIAWRRADHILYPGFRASHLFLGLSVGVFILLTVLIVVLMVFTARNVAQLTICVEEEY